MKKNIRRFAAISILSLSLTYGVCGCVDTSSYHEMTAEDDKWLTEQVENGTLTKDEAERIWVERNGIDDK